MRATRRSINTAFGNRKSFGAGPSGRAITSAGSRGQSDLARRTLEMLVTASTPGRGLVARAVAPTKERFVWAQSAVCVVPVVPQTRSVVFAPPRVTVPAMPWMTTERTRPPASRTITGLFVRNLTSLIPSVVSVKRQAPSSVGAAVKDHSSWVDPTTVRRKRVGAGVAEACAAPPHTRDNKRRRLIERRRR